MPFVPRTIRRSAGVHIVRPGDSLVSIAAHYGQPAVNYRDLVAANPRKPLRFHGMPRGSSAVFAELREGEAIRLPWFWFAGKNAGQKSKLAPGMVGDVQVDSIETFVAQTFAQVYQDKAMRDAMTNAVVQWWKQNHPGGGAPSTDADKKVFELLAGNAFTWWKAIGSGLAPNVSAGVPWNETPWQAWGKAIAQGFRPGNVNWGIVNHYLEQHAGIGDGPGGTLTFDTKTVDWNGNIPDTATPWKKAFWSFLPEVRFDLLPLDAIDFSSFPKGGEKEGTEWLMGKLKAIYQPSDQIHLDPGKVDPGKWGGGGSGDVNPCPPNRILIGGKCFVEPQNGLCPEGLLLVKDPSTGIAACKPQDKPQAEDSSSSLGPVILVGGVLVGALALFLANRK